MPPQAALQFYSLDIDLNFLCSWSPGIANQQKNKQELIKLYRASKILNTHGMNEAKNIVLVSIIISAGIMITGIFPLIAFYDDLDTATFITLMGRSTAAGLTTKACLEFAAKLKTLSEDFRESFLRNDFTLNKIQRKEFQSCGILAVLIGNYAECSETTFSSLMVDVVIDNIITLVLLSREL